MRPCATLFLLATLAAPAAFGQSLATRCRVASSYDLTVQPAQLVFERAAPAPATVRIAAGRLQADGQSVVVRAEAEDRLVLFERELRALLPRVRAVATAAVDVTVQGLDAEADRLSLAAATRAQLDRRLASEAAALRERIARSQSTRDWDEDAMRAQGQRLLGDIAPRVAADLGQQALQAAMAGDLATATRLQNEATDLAATLQPRLQRRLAVLAPQVDALCPALRRLAALQEGLRDAQGRPLQLFEVGG